MRSFFYWSSIICSLLVLGIYQFWTPIIYFLIILVPYIAIGVHDVLSLKHTLLRNYPVVGHMRYMLEFIRPEIQQYFVESDKDGTPYPREIRSLIYQKSKGVRETIAFGTKNDITSVGYQFSYPSLAPKEVAHEKARIIIGGKDCKQPGLNFLSECKGFEHFVGSLHVVFCEVCCTICQLVCTGVAEQI